MKAVIKKVPQLTYIDEKTFKTYRVSYECGKCHKKLTKYWNYCAYCGEKIER